MDEFTGAVVGRRERLLNLAVDMVMRARDPSAAFDASVLAQNIATVHEALLVRMKGGEDGADV